MSSFYGESTARLWWLFQFLFCWLLQGVALYYQYVLDQLPCVLCIHVRMLLFALAMVSLFGVFLFRTRTNGIFLFTSALIWLWLAERSYQLLGTERGWILGECQMQSGLPAWLALEEWLPWLFRIHEPCGYTPLLIPGVTMAEALIVICPAMFLVSGIWLTAYFRARPPRYG